LKPSLPPPPWIFSLHNWPVFVEEVLIVSLDPPVTDCQ
jgi:hypothetical protein